MFRRGIGLNLCMMLDMWLTTYRVSVTIACHRFSSILTGRVTYTRQSPYDGDRLIVCHVPSRMRRYAETSPASPVIATPTPFPWRG